MTIRVLFVDDEPQLLEGIRLALRRSGLVIETAASAEDALAFLANNDVDVVVSDERMPGTQGSELLADVRQAMPDTVRILLTGQASVEAAVRAVNQAAVHRFLTKPTSPRDLLATITELVARRDAQLAAKKPPPVAPSAPAVVVTMPPAARRRDAMAALEEEHPGIGRIERSSGGYLVLNLDEAEEADSPYDTLDSIAPAAS